MSTLRESVADFSLARDYIEGFATGLRGGDAIHLAIAANQGAKKTPTLDIGLLAAGKHLALPVTRGIRGWMACSDDSSGLSPAVSASEAPLSTAARSRDAHMSGCPMRTTLLKAARLLRNTDGRHTADLCWRAAAPVAASISTAATLCLLRRTGRFI
jgi:hypothetical protein